MTDAFRVSVVRPPHDLVLTVPEPGGGHQVSWEFFLQSLAGGRTRLIVRGRISPHWPGFIHESSRPPGRLILIERIYEILARTPRPLMLAAASFGHYMMQARMLRDIKLEPNRLVQVKVEPAQSSSWSLPPAGVRRVVCLGSTVSIAHSMCSVSKRLRRRPQGVHKAILADSPRRFRWTRALLPAPCCEGDFQPSVCSPPAEAGYSSCLRHHSYGGVWRHPGGESSHVSCRP